MGQFSAKAQAIVRTVTAILSVARAFSEPEKHKKIGEETEGAAGRIAVTVRPIARAAVGKLPAIAEQLGALSPQFGEEGL